MKKVRSLFLLLLIVLIVPLTIHAQSVYQLKYKSLTAGDTATVASFFMLASNGTGIARSKPEGTEDITEMEILEQYATGKDGLPDTTFVLYEGMNSRKVKGNAKKAPAPVTFWFKLTTANQYMPWAVTAKPDGPAPALSNLQAADVIQTEDIVRSKPVVLSYFDTASYYYQNLYVKKNTGTRGGSGIDPKSTRMFLLVVASTKDSSLMPNCLTDVRKVVDVFTDIAENELGIGLFVDSVYGNRYNKTNVENAINKLKPGKNDIVVFYYSGHGFTDRKIPAKEFPFLDLRDPNNRPRPDARTQTLNIQDIYSSILKKGARLNLVISDCCNDTIEAKKSKSTTPPPITRAPVKYTLGNLTSLFLAKTPMNFLMTAASKDERAIITPRYSSYFTYFFIESMRTYLSPAKGSPTWFQVMEDAKKQTVLFAGKVTCPNGKKCQQTPKLFLSK